VEYDFLRLLVDKKLIPDDVKVQVLTQAREHLITRTFESLAGLPHAIVHLYNSTSTLQRKVVFNKDRKEILQLAVDGVKLIKSLCARTETKITLEYSPESFTGTELDFAVDVCDAVMEAWGASADNQMIINLPATVEMSTPNIYADQIEWIGRNIKNRECYVLSLHPHNDRGTAVAATELAVMAGADRIEGTLFGNGERTGNVDVVTLALNMFSQGVDPRLDLSDIDRLRWVAEYCNQLPVHPRHPYAGDLVYTAFSGSHQDAIKKGMAALKQSNSEIWEVPYLPIDPQDLGRSYEAIIRINSQSGKGGIAYIMQEEYHLNLPRRLQIEFSQVIQAVTDASGEEIAPRQIWEIFEGEYLSRLDPYEIVEHQTMPDTHATERRILTATITDRGEQRIISGIGNGPIDAFTKALAKHCGVAVKVHDYSEHSTGTGEDATAVAYVEVADEAGKVLFGVGIHPNIVMASLKAVVSAVNRHLGERG
jgi:2-isopropylmalate synthase